MSRASIAPAVGLAVFALGVLSATGCGESYPPTSEGLYMAKCSRCHEADGSSATATKQAEQKVDLRSDFFQRNVSDQEIVKIMNFGTGRMQGIGGLTRAENDSILLQVRRLGGRLPAFLDDGPGTR